MKYFLSYAVILWEDEGAGVNRNENHKNVTEKRSFFVLVERAISSPSQYPLISRHVYVPINHTKVVAVRKDEIVVIEELDDLGHGHNFAHERHQLVLGRFDEQIHQHGRQHLIEYGQEVIVPIAVGFLAHRTPNGVHWIHQLLAAFHQIVNGFICKIPKGKSLVSEIPLHYLRNQ